MCVIHTSTFSVSSPKLRRPSSAKIWNPSAKLKQKYNGIYQFPGIRRGVRRYIGTSVSKEALLYLGYPAARGIKLLRNISTYISIDIVTSQETGIFISLWEP